MDGRTKTGLFMNINQRGRQMKREIRRLSIFLFLLLIFFAMSGISEANFEGTIGTRFTITGLGFGAKKPQVYIEYEKKPGVMKKVSAKVETWSDTSITCLWTKKLSPGTYNLLVKPNIKTASPIGEGKFTVRKPAIDEVTPDTLTPGATIAINGQFFTNKKPAVYLKDLASLKTKSCRVISSTMDPETGESLLNFVVPKSGSGNYEIILQTSVGEASINPPPTPPTLVSIAVTPSNPSGHVGATQQFTATGTYSDGTSHNVTTSVNWSSSNTSVATINGSGFGTAISVGTATFTATLGSISGNTTVTMTERGGSSYQYKSTLGVTMVYGSDNSHFSEPWGVAVDDSGNVYVADTFNNRIQIFNSSGTYVRTIGETGVTGSYNSTFSGANGVAVDGLGNVYVADTYNQRIQIFNSSGTYVRTIGETYNPDSGSNNVGLTDSTSCYTDNSHFCFPSGVAVDGSGNVYVADSWNSRIQIFNSSGTYVSTIGETYNPYVIYGWGDFGRPYVTYGGCYSDNSHFCFPSGVAVDGSGNVYVADSWNDRIQIFNSSGTYVSTIGVTMVYGSDNSHFNGLVGVAVDSPGNVYVADSRNSRIQIFNSSGTYMSTIGVSMVYGSDNSHFNSLGGVAVDSSGNVYVADTLNERIQIFSPD